MLKSRCCNSDMKTVEIKRPYQKCSQCGKRCKAVEEPFVFFKHGTFEFKCGVLISFWQTITEVFKMNKFNWSTFQFILVEFENERAMHNMSFTFVFLCMGVRIMLPTFPKEEHSHHKEVRKSMDTLLRDSDENMPYRERQSSCSTIQSTPSRPNP
jgi:hypothetical protein